MTNVSRAWSPAAPPQVWALRTIRLPDYVVVVPARTKNESFDDASHDWRKGVMVVVDVARAAVVSSR